MKTLKIALLTAAAASLAACSSMPGYADAQAKTATTWSHSTPEK